MPIEPVPSSAAPAFRLNSLPPDAFAHPAWVQAEWLALEAIGGRERVLLLGRPGTGKTLLLRSLERTLQRRGVSVRHLRIGDTLNDLSGDDVLLIDEADLWTEAELETIIRLPNAMVAAGLPSLPERLRPRPLAVRCISLAPLSPEDVARFVLTQLAASGRSRGMFAPDALVALARQSGGLLRLVIILAGAALFVAERRGAAEVTADDIAEAAMMRTVAPVEAEADTLPRVACLGVETATKEVSGESAETKPAWPDPVEPGTRSWARPIAIAGLTGWACASLAVIAVATIAARGISSLPLVAVQDLQGRSAPKLAGSPAPDLAQLSKPEPTVSVPVPVQTASAMPAPQAAGAGSPAPSPAPLPQTEQSEIEIAPPPPALLASGSALPEAVRPPTVLAFAGPILNDTMGQGGQLSLELHASGAHGPVAAVFHASNGLIGSGVLKGEIGSDGRVTLTGRLMMGRNPFDCALQATLKGERLVGAATFIRATTGAAAHSSFTLTKL